MAQFLSKHCFCSLKHDILQSFHILSTLFCLLQAAYLTRLLGPKDPQNITNVEFENFAAKHYESSLSLVFLQTCILSMSFDGKDQHSSLIERPCILKF